MWGINYEKTLEENILYHTRLHDYTYHNFNYIVFLYYAFSKPDSGTARIVNYAGLVRGKTQRIIKLEDARQPHDEMIESVSSYIKGLRYGSKELNLVRLDDKAFQSKMQELNSYFKELCDEIQLVREKGHEHTSIIDKSEHFFQICDEATGLAEAYSQEKASALSRLEQIVFVDIGGLIILIAIELVKALRYAAQNRILQSKVYLDEATGLPNKK